jgi:phospholipase C
MRTLSSLSIAMLLLAIAGCSSGTQSSLPYMRSSAAMRALEGSGAGKITHIVYIVQENRSFDNLFQGYPGADTVSSGKNSHGETIKLQPVPLSHQYVIDHSAEAMFSACDAPAGDLPGTHCRMDGFDQEYSGGGPSNPEYVYVPHGDSKPYFDMAHEGVLADRMFQSQLDESFVGHQYVIAAQAAWSVDLPYGAWGCEGGSYDEVAIVNKDRTINQNGQPPCYDYTTLGDELDTAGLTWRFYAATYGSASDGAEWSSYQAIKHIYNGPDWKKDVISPNWKFLDDVKAGTLENFTWITPVCVESDHVNCPGGYGPSWVAALVNAVGESKFWDSTAIFIQWDDWGGLYDHVPPKYLDRDSTGFRVPLVILSPYAIENKVSHVPYETASVLRFAEDLWGLPQMAPADRRANSPAGDSFDFTQSPQKFQHIKAPLPPKFFKKYFPSNYWAPDYE